jgi:uncharacterized protein (TIGR03435 family)
MNKQNLHDFLDQSFARFRELPSDRVELGCERVLDRLEKETDRTPEAAVFYRRSSRRNVRLVVLIAAAAAIAALAQQIATRMSKTPPTGPPAREEVVTVPQQSIPTVPAPTKPATPPAKPRTEFAAVSLKVLPPGTRMPAMGLACTGADGVERVVLSVMPGMQDAVKAPRGRCVGSGIFLSTLIEMAYGVSPRHISGGPDWSRMTAGMLALSARGAGTASARILFPSSAEERAAGPAYEQLESFQIDAVAENPATATLEQLREMLRSTLAERFKLRFHFEPKEIRGYSLVVAEQGHKIKQISGEYVESIVFFQGKSTMDTLARNLNRLIGGAARIVNKTGLNGAYEYHLEPFERPGLPRGFLLFPEDPDELSALLEEQHGLRLQREKAMSSEALVIDSVERPSSN